MDNEVALDLILACVARGIPQTLRARGRSMEQAIPDGAQVELVPLTVGDLPRLGDVVAARGSTSGFVIHRIIGTDGNGRFLLCGDNNRAADGWVAREHLVARVLRVDVGTGWRAVGDAQRPPSPSVLARAVRRLRRAL